MSESNTLEISRVFPCSQERLWKAWSDWENTISWWGPVDWPAVQVEADFREGGNWSAELRSETGASLFQSGEFLEITPVERLVFTFRWDSEDHEDAPGIETRVEVQLSEVEQGALMRFRQTGLTSTESVESHNGGWMSCFDRLEQGLV